MYVLLEAETQLDCGPNLTLDKNNHDYKKQKQLKHFLYKNLVMLALCTATHHR